MKRRRSPPISLVAARSLVARSRLLAACCALVGVMGAMLPTAVADIAETKHNLSTFRPDLQALSGERRRVRIEREVCVFCHTPTLSEEELAGGGVAAAPLWAPRTVQGREFQFFDDIGRAGTPGASSVPVGSVSMACLSCHDHSQALGMGVQVTQDEDINRPALVTGSDHPYGVPYRGWSDKAAVRQIREDLKKNPEQMSPMVLGRYIREDSEFRAVQTGVINQRRVWWASLDGVAGQRTKSDLPLYPRAMVDSDLLIPFVECTSCHDPHVDREVFLRTSNNEGRLCLTCHIK